MKRASVPLLCVMACVATTNAALYEGNFLNGGSFIQGAWSYGYLATSSPMNPGGNWAQYAGGTPIFALDPNHQFQYEFVDNGPLGLGAGDVVKINTEIPVLDFSGHILGSHTLGTQVGTVTLSGFWTVGGTDPANHTHGLGGSGAGPIGTGFLDFEVKFTDAAQGGFDQQDYVKGALFAQARALTSEFNGITMDGNDLRWSIWADNRPPAPNFFDSNDLDHSEQDPVGTFYDSFATTVQQYDDFGFGMTLVVDSTLVDDPQIIPNPEPASLVAWGLLLVSSVVGYRVRNKRRQAS